MNMTKVTLLNFSEGPRVVYDVDRKPRNVEVGYIVDVEMTDTNVQRITQRDPGLVVLPPDLAERQHGPQMGFLLDTLRTFDAISYDEALGACERILGVGAIGMKPPKGEIRMALAKRAKDAAFYIQQGHNTLADEVLGAKLPPIEVQRAALEASKAEERGAREAADMVLGDPIDGLTPAPEGPGVALTGGAGYAKDKVLPPPQRVSRRRDPPTRVARVARKPG